MELLQPTRNVIIGVDIQNDFIHGSLPVPGGTEVVAPINKLTAAAREHGDTVVFTRDWHPIETPHFDTWPIHCVEGTEGAAFHPELAVTPQDIVISKGTGQTHGYSGMEGFSANGTTLESVLRPESRVQRVNAFVGGLATDYCVKATAIDIATAFKDDERVRLFLIRDAIRAVSRDTEAEALAAIAAAGVEALSSQEILSTFFGERS